MAKKKVTLYIEEELLGKLDAKNKSDNMTRVEYFDTVLRKNLLSWKDRKADIEDFMRITAGRLKSIDSQQTIIIEMIYRLQRYLFQISDAEHAQSLLLEFGDELANALIVDNTFLSLLENLTSLKIDKEELHKK